MFLGLFSNLVKFSSVFIPLLLGLFDQKLLIELVPLVLSVTKVVMGKSTDSIKRG